MRIAPDAGICRTKAFFERMKMLRVPIERLAARPHADEPHAGFDQSPGKQKRLPWMRNPFAQYAADVFSESVAAADMIRLVLVLKRLPGDGQVMCDPGTLPAIVLRHWRRATDASMERTLG